MKSLRDAVLVAVFAASAAAGCEKPNDLPRLQDEAVATAKIFQHRLDELARRATLLGPRVAALPSNAPETAHARQVYQRALATIEEHRRDLQQQLPAGAQVGDANELARRLDHVREHQEHGATEATSQLSAVESWVAIAEQRHSAPRAAAAAPDDRADDRPSGLEAPAR